MKNYKCNKCGRVVQAVVQDCLNPEKRDVMLICQLTNVDQECDGQLLPINIKPAPCKDCD